jgi:hypothetical protein
MCLSTLQNTIEASRFWKASTKYKWDVGSNYWTCEIFLVTIQGKRNSLFHVRHSSQMKTYHSQWANENKNVSFLYINDLFKIIFFLFLHQMMPHIPMTFQRWDRLSLSNVMVRFTLEGINAFLMLWHNLL